MRLAIVNLSGGGLSGGHVNFLRNMLPRFAGAPSVEALLCVSPRQVGEERWFAEPLPKTTFHACRPYRPFLPRLDRATVSALDAFRPDVILSALEKDVRYLGAPVVGMIQNMAFLAGTPTGYGLAEKVKAAILKRETLRAASGFAAVIVPTAFVRDALAGAGISGEKVSVVNFGRNPPQPGAVPPAPAAGLRDRFIFTAGSFERYRGFEDLVEAMPALLKIYPGLKLLVAGGARPATRAYSDGLKKRAAELGLEKDILWLGNLPDRELSWCYAHCAAFAVTSRVESFCFVALEAMSHGCNSVSADARCLPEVLGETALYYPAGDAGGLERSLAEVLARTGGERERFSALSLKRSAGFSWDAALAGILAVLESVTRK